MKLRRLIAALTVFCLLLSNVSGLIPVAHATEAEEHDHDHETIKIEETVEETASAVSEKVEETAQLPENSEAVTEETTPVIEETAPVIEETETVSEEEYPALELGVVTDAVISTGGEYVYFSFVPTVTDYYIFTSHSNRDTYGHLYDAEMNQITTDDDGGENSNFRIRYLLEKDVQYYFAARYYYSDITGTIPVSLEYGHSYTSAVTTAPTCTEDGIRTYTCAYCAYSYEEAIAAAHTFSEVEITVEATCTTDGIQTYICSACGYEEERTTSALGHSFSGTVCTRCGLDMLENMTDVVVGQTMTAQITYGQGQAFFSIVPTATHTYSFTSDADDDTYGYLYDAELNVLATDDDDGVGNNFLLEYTLEKDVQYYFAAKYLNSNTTGSFDVVVNLVHSYDSTVTTPATCTEDGLMTYTCQYCEDSYTEVIEAGHTMDGGVITQEATCTENGTMKYTCTSCGYEETYVISALGHSYEGTICTRCGGDMQTLTPGTTLTANITAAGEKAYFSFVPEVTDYYSFTSSYSDDYMDLYGHLYNSELSYLAEDDDSGQNGNFKIVYLLEAGVQYYFAGRFYSSNATGSFNVTLDYSHSFTSEVTTAPTCTEDGEATLTCQYCGFSKTEVVPAAHSFGEAVVEVAPTCTQLGTSSITCTACGYKETWNTGALGHDFEDAACTRCGLNMEESSTAIGIDEETSVTIDTANEMVYYSITPEMTEYFRIYSSGTYDTLGYLYDAEMNQLRSNDDGGQNSNFQIYYTLQAGQTYYLGVKMNVLDETGSFTVTVATHHSYIGAVTTEPTCSSEGAITYTCEYCEDSYSEPLSALAHTYVDGVCTVCGADILEGKTELQLDTRFNAVIEQADEFQYFYFIPEVTERYQFYSSTNKDTVAYLYDENMNQLGYNDDDGEDNNFALDYTMTAGELYILGAKYLNSSNTGTFPVYLTTVHEFDYVVTTPNTCTEDGLATLSCVHCDYSKTQVIEAGHSWGETVTEKEITCTTAGLFSRTCTVCGEVESWTNPANGHRIVNGVCEYCHEDVLSTMPSLPLDTETPAAVSDYGQYVYFKFTPEVTECYEFYSTGTSAVRGYVYDMNWSRLASSGSGSGDGSNFRVYGVDLQAGETYILAARLSNTNLESGSFNLNIFIRHAFEYIVETEPTCTESGVARLDCVYCDYSYTEEIDPAHKYGEEEVLVAPTCTEEGRMRQVCVNCGKETTWYVSALGHDCVDGVCTVCGLDIVAVSQPLYLDTVTESKFETVGEMKYFVFTPTVEESYRFYSTGNRDTFAYLYDENFNILRTRGGGGTGENFSFQYVLDAGSTYYLGVECDDESTGDFGVSVTVEHAYYSEVTTPNTCTEDGVRTYYCAYCDYSYEEAIPAAHTWGAGAVCTVCATAMPTITLDTETIADIQVYDGKAYFKFVPEYSEGYLFRSKATNFDTYGVIYDEQMNRLASNDDYYLDGDYSVNFGVAYDLVAGQTYILEASMLNEEDTGSFPIVISVSHSYEGVETTPHSCTEDGVMTYTCKYCDDSYTEVSYGQHNFEGGDVCTVCGMELVLSGQCGDNLTWTIDTDEGSLTISGTGAMWNFETEAPWHQLWNLIDWVELSEGITSISDYAFADLRYIYSISVPETVTAIGNSVVSGCDELQEFRFSGSAPTFADNAFAGVKLYAYYPEGDATWVANVRKNYGGDVKWRSYTYILDEGTISADCSWTLHSNGYLEVYGDNDSLPDWASPEQVPWHAYADIITEVYMHGITHIGDYAFAELPSLRYAYFNNGLQTIGEHAFSNCTSLSDMHFEGNAPDISYNAFENVTASCYYNASNSGWIPSVLQNYMGDLDWHAQNNGFLDDGYFGDLYWEISKTGNLYINSMDGDLAAMPSYESASDYPWYQYLDLIVSIDAYIAGIGAHAFEGYANLEYAYFGESLATIGAKAFANCSSLEYISFQGDAPEIASDAFEGVVAEAGYHRLNTTWTEEKRQNYGGELEWYSFSKGIEWGSMDGIEWNLQDDGALHLYGNKDMFVMDSAADYPWNAYADQITRLYVNCTSISDYAFASLPKLEAVYIQTELNSIGTQAFAGCGALTTVRFNYSDAPEIASDAFKDVTATVIYDGVNDTWTAAKRANYGGTLTWVANPAVVASGTYGAISWKLSDEGALYLKGDNAAMTAKTAASSYPWYTHRASVKYVIVEGITNVADYAFSGYTALLSAEFDEALTAINANAFKNSTKLEAFYFYGDAPTIASTAFAGVTAEAWYNQGKDGWTESVLTNYGGTISWIAYGNPKPVYEMTFTSGSVSLAGDIGLNFYVELSDDIVSDGDAYMEFTYGDNVYRMYLHDAIANTDGTYRFSCPLAAKQMTEVVTAQLYISTGAVGEAKTYSVKEYCEKAIPVYSAYPAYANLVELMKAMLNYGGYSQVQFGYKTGDLANAGLNLALPTLTEDMLSAYAHGQTGTESGISISSVSLLLESTTTVRFYFKLDGTRDISTYSFFVDGVKVKPVQSAADTYYVDKTNVAAKELDEMVTVRVGGMSVWYSGLSYVRQAVILYPTYYSDALKNVAKALYAYNQAANNYFS